MPEMFPGRIEFQHILEGAQNIMRGRESITNPGQYTIIEPGAAIGQNCIIGSHNVIRNGARIGDHVYISHHCVIARGTIIEDDVFIGPNVTFTNTKHICHGRDRKYTGESTPSRVCRGARIGAGVTILPGIVIGEECEIGAAALVSRSCQEYGRYWGIPAKFVGYVPKEEMLIKRDIKE